MGTRRFAWTMLALILGATPASAQEFPAGAVRLVTSGTGGGNDFIARDIAQGIAKPLGHPVTVENLHGGVAPGEAVAKSAPDGRTVLVYNNTLWIGPLLQHANYDAARDFAPVGELARTPNVLVVNASAPAKSVPELIALARSRPGDRGIGAAAYGVRVAKRATSVSPETPGQSPPLAFRLFQSLRRRQRKWRLHLTSPA